MAVIINVLCLVCASQLLFGGVRPQRLNHFSSAGDNSTLPCYGQELHGPACSDVDWLYLKELSRSRVIKVSKGQVLDRSSRLTLNPDCSLSLQNVSVEDSGVFICQLHGRRELIVNVFLRVLTVSPTPADSDEFITLQCMLGTYDAHSCGSGSFRWIEQSQVLKVISGERKNCVSYLTVERVSQHDRTFTCQFVESSTVKVFAEFSIEGKRETVLPRTPEYSLGWWFLVLKSVGWGALMCTTVVVSIYTRDRKQPKRSSGGFEMESYPGYNPGDAAPDYENQR